MNARRIVIALAIALQSLTAFGASRITFTRTIPATHDLSPARRIAVVSALGDTDRITIFLNDFLDRTNRSGIVSAEMARDPSHSADAYLSVHEFTCDATERNAVGSERDTSGDRVKRTQQWLDATCRARIDVMSGAKKKLFSFLVKGEGTSPRVAQLTDEERNVAFDQAAHYAAINAAEAITPRVVRESIELDDAAPAFEEAYAMVAASRHADARAIWESTLRRHQDSAALQFDLGAVCEALGDMTSAKKYYEEARRLSPGDSRYRSELTSFLKRTASK